ncbi:hypothetical protein PHSY_005351 [Pseudozyma hubeiensis SY62]|uniref:Uncharacterized protein n=1 Tax=Pseudozyma hubeiensis (strain SY62) TaxID=1305764 RepID=R9P8U2_PSEHS|nr:hypothetical protein PHSY_005351 [Pseudozyma hubeiensis SY62]GAC97764.1 hypothetical protein PHSY_005351 [Pseudozyma hubeiensis SY62]
MAGSTVELFSTSILSNVKVRTRHERYTSVLAIKKIPYVYHDLASDDDAKSRWRRKAKDAQLPGILVNNEWVGSFDDFEEAVEFGELELFLGVSPASAQAAPPAPHPAQSAVSSKDPSLYPTLPYAAEGAGRWKEPDADQFISSLNIKEDELTDADVDAMLADIGKLPAASVTSTTPDKKYVPSKEAAIKPLRFAKMGPTTSHQRMSSGSPSSSSVSSGTRASPVARYSATQRSTRALAAEAAALTSNRKTSGALLRDAVSQGKTLDDAMEQSRMKHIVSDDNIDDLFASLGLSNVDIADDEVEQFLEQGAIPQGLRLGGDRVHRSTSIADKARDQTVARDLARRAKDKGHGSARTSLTNVDEKLAALQPANTIASTDNDTSADRSTGPSQAALPPPSQNPVDAEATSVPVAVTTPGLTDEPLEPKSDSLDEALALSTKSGSATVLGLSSAAETKSQNSPAEAAPSRLLVEQFETDTSHNEDSTAENKASEAATAEQEPLQKSISTEILSSSASREEVHLPSGDAKEEATAAESAAATDIAADQKGSEAASTVEKSQSSTADEQNGVSVDVDGTDERKPTDLEEDKTDVPSTPSADTRASIVSTAVQEAKQASHDESLAVSGSEQTNEGRDRTQEIAHEAPSPPPAPAAAEADDEDTAFEREMAQAALIASRFEDHHSAIPIIQEPEMHRDSVPSGLEATSATSPMATAPSRSSLAAAQKPSLSSRQASYSSSSSSTSSSRKAIDVSRPIDSANASSQPSPSRSASYEFSTSPDAIAKRKKKGILGFGRDRSRDRSKDKDGETESARQPPAAGERRKHERTISEILREADAVLQSDDHEGDSERQGDENEEEQDTIDSAMVFGTSSFDDAAAPVPSLRGSSRRPS